jgi:hypothetical protein
VGRAEFLIQIKDTPGRIGLSSSNCHGLLWVNQAESANIVKKTEDIRDAVATEDAAS